MKITFNNCNSRKCKYNKLLKLDKKFRKLGYIVVHTGYLLIGNSKLRGYTKFVETGSDSYLHNIDISMEEDGSILVQSYMSGSNGIVNTGTEDEPIWHNVHIGMTEEEIKLVLKVIKCLK